MTGEPRESHHVNLEALSTDEQFVRGVADAILLKRFAEYAQASVDAMAQGKKMEMSRPEGYSELKTQLKSFSSINEIKEYCAANDLPFPTNGEMERIAEDNLNYLKAGEFSDVYSDKRDNKEN